MGGGGGRPCSAAATLGQKLSAITVATVSSGAPSWRPLPPGSLPALGAPGVRPAAGGPALRAAWGRMLQGAGAHPDCFALEGREEPRPRDWGPGGAGGGVVPPLVSPSVPRADELSLPLALLFQSCRSWAAATGECRAVRGAGVGKTGGLSESYGKNFPPLGTAKLTFLQRLSWFYSPLCGDID